VQSELIAKIPTGDRVTEHPVAETAPELLKVKLAGDDSVPTITDPIEIPLLGETERDGAPVAPDPVPEVVPEVVPEPEPGVGVAAGTPITPVTETCRMIPLPEFEHPIVKLVVKLFSDRGVPRTPIEQDAPPAIVEPQVLEEMVNTLGLLRETVHPDAATVVLVLLTVKVAVAVDNADTVTFPRLCEVEGLTERVAEPEPLPEVEPPDAAATILV
jgi:hypothetical protein